MKRRSSVVSILLAIVFIGVEATGASAGTDWTVMASPNPSSYGNILNAVAGISARNLWAVGSAESDYGTDTLIEHWNGSRWSVVPSPNPSTDSGCGYGNVLTGVYAMSARDAWTVGYSWSCSLLKTMSLHWNGTQWSVVHTPSPSAGGDNALNAVAAVASDNVWAVGYFETSSGITKLLVEHWNGTKWSVVKCPNPTTSVSTRLYGIAAISAADIWAVGSYYNPQSSTSETLIEHWDGLRWNLVTSPNPSPTINVLVAVAVISGSDVWAVGYQSNGNYPFLTLTEHWDGTAWSVIASPNLDTAPDSANVLRGIGVVSSNDIWAVGMYRNADTGQQHRPLIAHWDGAVWSLVASPNSGQSSELDGVVAFSSGIAQSVGLYSVYPVNIYDGTYTAPQTLVLRR